jgi:hypothetical protein
LLVFLPGSLNKPAAAEDLDGDFSSEVLVKSLYLNPKLPQVMVQMIGCKAIPPPFIQLTKIKDAGNT